MQENKVALIFSRRKAGSIADGVTLFVVFVVNLPPFDQNEALVPKWCVGSTSPIKAKLIGIKF